MNAVRAWKDPEYRASLASPPAHPAGTPGLTRLEVSDLSAAGAAAGSWLQCAVKTLTLTVPAWCLVSLNVCP
ncbi:mersacidin/lichenicidin family type 2 lantibiotic [Streptosporangium roseum]|uniref:mersacidin/lichenicidin family type 2 lantibiotic n=1 Tax=Streptosporangium roseum TaxID=2001 RepID=UPI00332DDEB4